MPPDENQPGSPQDWLRYADSDLELARIDPPPLVLLEDLCFHAQQAAEKGIKAVLILNAISFPRTHNLRTLVDLLPQDLNMPPALQEAVVLTDYAVASRYPGDVEPIEEEEYQEAIHLAEAVVTWAHELVQAHQLQDDDDASAASKAV